jgi:hypothetical protein
MEEKKDGFFDIIAKVPSGSQVNVFRKIGKRYYAVDPKDYFTLKYLDAKVDSVTIIAEEPRKKRPFYSPSPRKKGKK